MPSDANSFMRFAANSDVHNLQPRESVNATSPASAGLPFDTLPVFCPAASAEETSARRAPSITIHSLPDIVILIAILRPPRSPHSTDGQAPSIQGKNGQIPGSANANA